MDGGGPEELTNIPRRIRSVAWAMAAAIMNESATAIPGIVRMWSHRYKPSHPARSADSANTTRRFGSANSSNGGRKTP